MSDRFLAARRESRIEGTKKQTRENRSAELDLIIHGYDPVISKQNVEAVEDIYSAIRSYIEYDERKEVMRPICTLLIG